MALTLLGALLGLTQCKTITDPTTSVDVRENSTFDRSKRDGCERECEREYKRCRRAEYRRHERALRDCRELKKDKESEDEYRACRRAENRLHEHNLDECRAERRQCKRECRYREGSGKGGR